MSSITPPPDSAGTESLRQSNQKKKGVSSVSAVPAKPFIHQSPSATTTNSSHLKRRRLVERRKKDRRKQKQKVVLNTRSRHDRRTLERRNSSNKNISRETSTKEETRPQTRGVDITV